MKTFFAIDGRPQGNEEQFALALRRGLISRKRAAGIIEKVKAGQSVELPRYESEHFDSYAHLATTIELGGTYRRKETLDGGKNSFYKCVFVHNDVAVVECVRSPTNYRVGRVHLFWAKNGLKYQGNWGNMMADCLRPMNEGTWDEYNRCSAD